MIVLKHERNRPGIKNLTRRCGAFAAVDSLFFRFARLKRGGRIKLLRTAQVNGLGLLGLEGRKHLA